MSNKERKIAKMTLPKKILPIDSLIPYELNNKIHGDKKVNLLANIIDKFSYTDEVIVDKNNIVIAWHGRLKSLIKMWYDDVEVKVMDIDTEDAVALRYLHNEISRFDTEDNLEALSIELPWMSVILEELNTSVTELAPHLDAPVYNPDNYETNNESTEQSQDLGIIYIIKVNSDDAILLEQYLDENSISYTKKW